MDVKPADGCVTGRDIHDDHDQRAVSGSNTTSRHGPTRTGTSPQFNGTQRRSPARGSTANQRSNRSAPAGWDNRALAGRQVSGMAGHKGLLWHGLGGQRVASRQPPRGLPHRIPGAEPDDACVGTAEGCPRAAARSGCARSTGCHTHEHQRAGSSVVRRHVEEPPCDRGDAGARPVFRGAS